jgi:hypothetical protein
MCETDRPEIAIKNHTNNVLLKAVTIDDMKHSVVALMKRYGIPRGCFPKAAPLGGDANTAGSVVGETVKGMKKNCSV